MYVTPVWFMLWLERGLVWLESLVGKLKGERWSSKAQMARNVECKESLGSSCVPNLGQKKKIGRSLAPEKKTLSR